MLKRLSISTLIITMLFSFSPLGALAQTANNVAIEPILVEPPAEEMPVIYPAIAQFSLEVKWGHVNGSPMIAKKIDPIIFDGSISADNGSVVLSETLKFEEQGIYRDQITSQQDPVAWQSWVGSDWDGVKVNVKAMIGSKITIDTVQGAVALRASQLVRNNQTYKLELPNGQELVITSQVQPVITPATRYYLKVYWGVPKGAAEMPQFYFDLPASEQPAEITAPAEDSKALNIKTDIAVLSNDMKGSLSLSKASLLSVRPYYFEADGGDRITFQDEHSVNWDSTVIGDIDGLWLQTQLDGKKPNNERLGIAFAGDSNWHKFFKLKDLFANKRTVENFLVNGSPFQLVIEAYTIEKPIPPGPQPVIKPSFTYNLESGWNFVSAVTQEMQGQAISQYFPNAEYVYSHNGIQYQHASTFAIGQGYWLKNMVAEEITVAGTPITTHNYSFTRSGEHLVGAPFDLTMEGVPCVTSVSHYNNVTASYYEDWTIAKGSAAWVNISQDSCSFTRPGADAVNDPISISTPADGEVWRQGETRIIQWNPGSYGSYARYIKLMLNDDAGINISYDAETLAGGEFEWTINLSDDILNYLADKQVRIRVGVQPEPNTPYADSEPFFIKASPDLGGPWPLPVIGPPKELYWPQDSAVEIPTPDKSVNGDEPEYISVSDPRRFEGEKTEIYKPQAEEPKFDSGFTLTHEESKPLYDPKTFSQPVTEDKYQAKPEYGKN